MAVTVTVTDGSREAVEKFDSGTLSRTLFRVLALEWGDCASAEPALVKPDGTRRFDGEGPIPDGHYTYHLAPAQKKPPSEFGYNVVMDKQTGPDPTVLDFMPATAVPPLPIQLVCPLFGQFLDNVRNNNSRLPPATEDDFKHYTGLVGACSVFYSDESQLREELRKLWRKYLCTSVQDEVYTGFVNQGCVSRTDLAIRDENDALVWLAEVKRGVSTSKTEPRMEAVLNYRLNWFSARPEEHKYFSNTYHPVLVLQHIGQTLLVGAAAILPTADPGKEDKVAYQPLASLELVPIHRHDLQMAVEGVRACMAIKAAVQALLQLYSDANRVNKPQGPDKEIRALMEKWIPVPLLGDALALGGVKQFEEKKLVYGLGRLGETGSCVVKYCQRYGEKVHRAWAEAGYAPQLISVENLPGGWIEVRMEWLAGEEGWQELFDLEDKKADALRSSLVEVLKAAHRVHVGASQDGEPTFGVHGDMRDNNVMVRIKGESLEEVRFVDFDWATPGTKVVTEIVGRDTGEGEDVRGSCYPPFINHKQVNWPSGVAENKPMLQSHDLILLKLKQSQQIKQPASNENPSNEKKRAQQADFFKRQVKPDNRG